MNEALERAWNSACLQWPNLRISREQFAAHAREHIESATAEGLRDLVLACACLLGDRGGLRAFETEVMQGVGPAIARIEAQPDAVDEVKQQLRTRLLTGTDPKLRDFRGRGALAAWVNVSAIRTALNLQRSTRRKQQREASTDDRDDQLAELVLAVDTLDVELELLKSRFRAAFSRAIRAACRELSERNRALLKMQLVDGHGIDAIAEIYDVHRSTAARWMQRAREALQGAARARLQADLRMNTVDAQQVERLLHTQVSVSFSGLSGADR